MATSINSPAMSNAIRVDIPALNEIVKALAKLDPSVLADLQSGTKRIVEGTSGWEIQQLQGNTWTSLNKFNIDAQSVDGFSASTSATANTIPVRDANGNIPGNITGNAATATKASSLSSTLSVDKGGTGSTSPEGARENIGAAPVNHASTGGDFGASSATEFGHSKASSTSPKALGTASVGTETTSFARGDHVHPATTASDSVLGMVKLSDSTSSTSDASSGVAASPKAVKAANDNAVAAQTAAGSAATAATTAQSTADNAVATANSALAKADTSVQTSGNQTVAGAKTFTNIPSIKGAAPGIYFQDTNLDKGTPDTNANNDFTLNFFDKNGTNAVNRIGSIIVRQDKSGNNAIGLYAYKDAAGSSTNANLAIVYPPSGKPYAIAPTPDESSNATHVATTAWVRSNAKGIVDTNSGAKAGSYGPSAAATLIVGNGSSFYIPRITVNAAGKLTAAVHYKMTLQATGSRCGW